ncbi:transposase [Agrobacterium deltaense]|uniref:transposase n=1 Tax=Agrobacterium deltaense TaxID=1183412 RepID=UPI003FD53F56
MNKRYSEELRDRAVALVDERRLRNPRDRTIYREVAENLKIGEQSLRLWVREFDRERNARIPSIVKNDDDGVPEHVEAEMNSLRRRIEKLQAENDVLKRAFVVFSSEWSK